MFSQTGLVVLWCCLLAAIAVPGPVRAGDSAVIFTELNYAPTEAGGSAWLELRCLSGVDVDLSGYAIEGDVNYRFPPGSVVRGRGYLVVAQSPGALQGVDAFGPWSGQLGAPGAVRLVNQNGRLMDELEYDAGGEWPIVAGSGATLSKRNEESGDSRASNWVSSASAGGSPGRRNFSTNGEIVQVRELVGWNSSWKYHDAASAPAGHWMNRDFDDGAWKVGEAIFVGGEASRFTRGLVAYWPVTETSGSTIHNEVSGAAVGVLHGAVSLRNSGTRGGAVLRFSGNGGYVDAGATTLPFLTAESDVTWSFWTNNLETGTANVILGNRRAANAIETSPREFVKFTPVGIEYHRAGTPEGIAYSGIPNAQWVHHALVKKGTALNYYRNGVGSGSRTLGGGFLTQQPLYFGGDRTIESWTGDLDDIAIWNKALTSEEIANLASGGASPLTVSGPDTTTELELGSTAFYFRQAFVYDGAPANTDLALRLLVDDGAVVYLNGQRVHAQNMPAGGAAHSTLAVVEVGAATESDRIELPTAALVRGRNVVAVEVHQHLASGDPDLAFTAELIATERIPPPPDESPTLVFNEISAGGVGFQLEITNVGTEPIDLDGYQVKSSTGAVYPLPAQTLAPGGFVVLSAAALGFGAVKDDRLFLVSVDGDVLDGRIVTDKLRGRGPDGSWIFPATATFGGGNAFHLQDGIVINEIMYKQRLVSQSPLVESPEGWVELYNRSDAPVDLSGWKLSDGIQFTFPAGTVLASNGYLVVAKNASALAAKWPDVASRIIGNYSGNLSGKGERVSLEDAAGNPVDQVDYSDGGRWPSDPNGGGSSLELRSPHADNSAPEAWAASDESHRGQWQTFTWQGAAQNFDDNPTRWNEFVFGLLDAGTFLIDDITVSQGGANLIQNGGFEAGNAAAWRLLGTHRHASVIDDPTGGGKVLRIEASGATEHMHNHAETTLKNGGSFHTINGSSYWISFRARWVSGSNQLNARLYFNRLARTHLLPIAEGGGTPGRQNSRFEENVGPTYSRLTHFPAVPPAGEEATVSVTAGDPDGIAGLTLHYAVDGGAWATVAMIPDGQRYSAAIPGQSAGSKAQFYITATDQNGGTAFFPAAGPNSRAIVPWDDGQAVLETNGVSPTNIRIVMTEADADFLHLPTNVMSNDRLEATVIVNERDIYYGCGVRLKGSERGRNQQSRVGFSIRFPADNKLYGVHKTVSMDRARIGENLANIEMLIKRSILLAGDIPGSEDDLCRVIAPQARHTSMTVLSKSRFDGDYLDGQYENGADGMTFKMEYIYFPTTTSGGVEGLKLPEPDEVVGVPVAGLGADKERYRWHWLVENNEDVDDYSGLISFLTLFGQSASWPVNAQYYTDLESAMDVEQWLRAFAMMVLFGVGDNYGTGDNHNAIFYQRPGDGRFLFLPHDMDQFVFSFSATSGLAPSQDLQKIIRKPANKRAYYNALYEICQTAFSSAKLLPWAQHYSKFSGTNMPAYMGYIEQRRAHVLGVIAAEAAPVDFEITTPNGSSGDGGFAIIEGEGWIDIRDLRLAGTTGALPLVWTGMTTWQSRVPLRQGVNTFTVEAFDAQGALVGTDFVSLQGSTTVEPASAGKLVVSELMYHPPDSTLAEISAGFSDPEAFEFVEVQNISTSTLDLTGVRFTTGITYSFVADTLLGPGERLVIARDRAAFATRYGSGVPLAAEEFGPATRFDNAGELVVLADAQGADIVRFAYGDDPPWATEADGGGYSLVLTRSGSNSNPNIAANWRPSGFLLGNPGTTDATVFSGNPDGDDDGNGVPNLVQYAAAGSGEYIAPSLFLMGGQLVFRYQRNLTAEDVKVRAESSTVLGDWGDLPSGSVVTSQLRGDGTVLVTCRGIPPSVPSRFFRVRVEHDVP